MTSEERHEARYQRRKAARVAKRDARIADYLSLPKVISSGHMYRSYQKCRKDVNWKYSTQKESSNSVGNTKKDTRRIRGGGDVPGDFYEFDIVERGKPRHIRSVHIRERVVQRCLCDYSLVPILCRSLIYDNSATIEGKGTAFARKRLAEHIRRYVAENGPDGYILTFDFHKYFDNIVHKTLCRQTLHEYGTSKVKPMITNRIKKFGKKGLGLGSQVSQISAVAYPSPLDHFIKDKLSLKYYHRYMDDGYIIHNDKVFLTELADKIKEICEQLGIKMNEKKTQIHKLRKGFEFLQIKYFITDTGKLVKRYMKKAARNLKRRLRKYKEYLREGKQTIEKIKQSTMSWLNALNKIDCYKTRMSIQKYFYRMYGVRCYE